MPAASRSRRRTPRPDVQVSEAVRWYVWDGGFLAIGRAQGVVPRHAHHALQIVVALESEIAVEDAAGRWQSARGLIVGSDHEHSFDAQGDPMRFERAA